MLAANLANDLTKRVILDVLKLYHDKLCVFFISDVVVFTLIEQVISCGKPITR